MEIELLDIRVHVSRRVGQWPDMCVCKNYLPVEISGIVCDALQFMRGRKWERGRGVNFGFRIGFFSHLRWNSCGECDFPSMNNQFTVYELSAPSGRLASVFPLTNSNFGRCTVSQFRLGLFPENYFGMRFNENPSDLATVCVEN